MDERGKHGPHLLISQAGPSHLLSLPPPSGLNGKSSPFSLLSPLQSPFSESSVSPPFLWESRRRAECREMEGTQGFGVKKAGIQFPVLLPTWDLEQVN